MSRTVPAGIDARIQVFDVWDFLDGKHYVLDGISGTFSFVLTRGRNGMLYADLYHTPDKKGRESSSYREKRARYGDDWDTCLTDDIEGYCAIARELGYQEPA